MKKTTLYLSEEQMAELDAHSQRSHRPKAQVIREALAEYLVDVRAPLPDWIGMIDDDDDSLTSENVDEWLRENWHPESSKLEFRNELC